MPSLKAALLYRVSDGFNKRGVQEAPARLTGDNAHLRGTIFSNGILIAASANALGLGGITVAGGVLGGSYTVTGAVAVLSGAMLTAGETNTTGTATLQGGLSLAAGSALTVQVAGSNADRLVVSGGDLAVAAPVAVPLSGPLPLHTKLAAGKLPAITLNKERAMNATRLAVLTVSASALLLAAGVNAADWPTFLGPDRDGCSADTGLLKQWPKDGPAQLWKNDKLGEGWSSVAVVGGFVFTTGNEGGNQMLICLDDKTGQEKWRAAQGPAASHNKYPGARATPTVDGDRIYLTGGNGLFTCQSAKDGRILWKKDMRGDLGGKCGGWLYAESVTILGKLAIVTPGGQHPVAAFDKMTGSKVWDSDKAATAGYASLLPVTLNNSTVLVNGTQSGLLAIDAKTGRELYRNPFAENNVANAPTPAFSDGYLFWAVGYRKGGICLKVANADGKWSFEEAWTSKDFACHPGNYVVAKGRVFGKGRGGLVCADLKTGKTLWTERGGAGQVLWADGRLYSFADQGGRLTLIDPDDTSARVKGSLQVAGSGNSWSHPVVVNGRLYLRYDTNLYCFDVKAK